MFPLNEVSPARHWSHTAAGRVRALDGDHRAVFGFWMETPIDKLDLRPHRSSDVVLWVSGQTSRMTEAENVKNVSCVAA